ncbi:hypothetical protein GCM10017554_09630 [Acinetobacter modestus]|nr:hypothetical protein GCM10017554_09630 [Acinetobacter modestus]
MPNNQEEAFSWLSAFKDLKCSYKLNSIIQSTDNIQIIAFVIFLMSQAIVKAHHIFLISNQ